MSLKIQPRGWSHEGANWHSESGTRAADTGPHATTKTLRLRRAASLALIRRGLARDPWRAHMRLACHQRRCERRQR